MTQPPIFRHVKLGQPCVYKKVACSFKGGCRQCPVWKKKEIEMLSKEVGD